MSFSHTRDCNPDLVVLCFWTRQKIVTFVLFTCIVSIFSVQCMSNTMQHFLLVLSCLVLGNHGHYLFIYFLRYFQVRIYTPKSVFQELEVAKEEYIYTNIRIKKGQKLFLPKLVEMYAKESSLCMNGLMDMIEHYVPEFYLRSFKLIRTGKSSKKIEWVPHNFSFRYLIFSQTV